MEDLKSKNIKLALILLVLLIIAAVVTLNKNETQPEASLESANEVFEKEFCQEFPDKCKG